MCTCARKVEHVLTRHVCAHRTGHACVVYLCSIETASRSVSSDAYVTLLSLHPRTGNVKRDVVWVGKDTSGHVTCGVGGCTCVVGSRQPGGRHDTQWDSLMVSSEHKGMVCVCVYVCVYVFVVEGTSKPFTRACLA